MADGIIPEWAQPAPGKNLTKGPLFDDESAIEARIRAWEALLDDRCAATAGGIRWSDRVAPQTGRHKG
jgi:hypothetical protein